MRKAYYIIRGISYTCGVAAVLLILWGGQGQSGYGSEIVQVGYLLLLLMFLLFCVSYVLYAFLRRRTR